MLKKIQVKYLNVKNLKRDRVLRFKLNTSGISKESRKVCNIFEIAIFDVFKISKIQEDSRKNHTIKFTIG